MTLDSLVGRLVLRPGRAPAVVCERPMVGAALLGRLTRDRRASLLPDLLASVFTLGVDAQRSTSRRAVMAALGIADPPAQSRRDARAIALHTAGDHLHRLALDLPTSASGGTHEANVGWLRDAPMHTLPTTAKNPSETALQAATEELPPWLRRRLFGIAAADWLLGWQQGGGDWLATWAAEHDHPVTRWLREVHDDARELVWTSPLLDMLQGGEAGPRELAASIAADARFAEAPRWRGATAETGPWTRHGRLIPVVSAWDRIGARLADLAGIACGEALAYGALGLGAGAGIAWTEMSRGLLVHWVQLQAGDRDPYTARVERYHVLAPTEWNFHPEGAFARALADGSIAPAQVALAAAALDPCLAFRVDVAEEAGDA